MLDMDQIGQLYQLGPFGAKKMFIINLPIPLTFRARPEQSESKLQFFRG